MYDHKKQYRCTIIRGKSQKDMDDLLPAYALVIDEICPCLAEEFAEKFNNEFSKYLPVHDRIKKTLDNHRTEISGKLFGMYFFAENGMVYESERTQKFLKDNDQPAFFKDICYKMQFPNGSQKIASTVSERISAGISIRPFAFILKLLSIAKTANIDITKKAIGYYVLNSLDVLQGKASPYEVLEVIAEDRKSGIERAICYPGKASSYCYQHINEQLNYLELANLIRLKNDGRVVLNSHEEETINCFSDDWDKKPEFDMYKYDISTDEGRKQLQFDWDRYFSKISHPNVDFSTKAEALIAEETSEQKDSEKEKEKQGINLVEFGDEGEEIVFNYEKQRVSSFNQRLANKVLSLGKTKGIGYDIQSVVAEAGEKAEFVKYIEVKSTKRLTVPDTNDNLWVDTINITRNEWVAAQQHGEYYSIFRVYFTKAGIFIFVLSNVAEKLKNGVMQATPTTYRVDFSNNSVDKSISL